MFSFFFALFVVYFLFSIWSLCVCICICMPLCGGRDSSAGIATRYGLDGLGIESRWGARSSAPVQTDPGAHPAFYTLGTASLLGVKRPGRGVHHPPPSSAEVEVRVELYIYSPSGPSWPVLGWILPLLYVLCRYVRMYVCKYVRVVSVRGH